MPTRIIGLVCCLSLSVACGDKDSETGSTTVELDGSALYTSNCATCHGADGELNNAKLPEIVPGLSAEELEDVITNVAPMSDIELTAAELSAIVDYLQETWPAR